MAIIAGPSQEIIENTEARIVVASADYIGTVTLSADKECYIAPRSFDLSPGQSVDVLVRVKSYGAYIITATGDNAVNVTLTFAPRNVYGDASSAELAEEIAQVLESVPVNPRFRRVLVDREGRATIQRSRQFVVLREGWEYGELFGTRDWTFRMLVGYLGARPTDGDEARITEAIHSHVWPAGVVGVIVRSGSVIDDGETGITWHEYTVQGTVFM